MARGAADGDEGADDGRLCLYRPTRADERRAQGMARRSRRICKKLAGEGRRRQTTEAQGTNWTINLTQRLAGTGRPNGADPSTSFRSVDDSIPDANSKNL